MVEAFTIERRIPDKRVGPAIVKGAWAQIATADSFADRVHQGELAREHVWDKWARAGGGLPYEVSRMEDGAHTRHPICLPFMSMQPSRGYYWSGSLTRLGAEWVPSDTRRP